MFKLGVGLFDQVSCPIRHNLKYKSLTIKWFYVAVDETFFEVD